jgi:hypothetical protein
MLVYASQVLAHVPDLVFSGSKPRPELAPGPALFERIKLDGGRLLLNPFITDYLLRTMPDMRPVRTILMQYPRPNAPFGVSGVRELSALSSTPAILNALRQATGLDLPRVPVRTDIVFPLPSLADHRRNPPQHMSPT